MSALLRVSVGAVAVGLCCLPLALVIAQQPGTRNPTQPGGIQQQPAQADPANPGQADRFSVPQLNRPQLQQGTQGRQPFTANYRGEQAKSGQASTVEGFFANCLLKNNQAEVELGQFAAEQAQDPKVKQFAEDLVKDHQKVVARLQQIAGTGGLGRGSATSLEADAQNAADRNSIDTTRTPGSPATDTTTLGATGAPAGNNSADRAAANQGGAVLIQLAAIEEKIDDRCNQALREELQSKSGAEFDQCFVGSQIAGHMHMLAALEVLSEDGQGQLKQVAEEAKPIVQKHLDHAKQLANQMKSAAQAQRTSPSRERQE